MGQSGSGTEGGGFFENLLYGVGNLGIDAGKGIVGGFKDAIGTVTGAKQANEAQKKAELRANQEAAQRDKILQDERFRRQQEDIAASQEAQAAQNRGKARSIVNGQAVYTGGLGDSGNESLLGL